MSKIILPPLPIELDEIEEVESVGQVLNLVLPGSRCQSYIAILEDALEQLLVLSDIIPDAFRTDNKQVENKVIKIMSEQTRIIEALKLCSSHDLSIQLMGLSNTLARILKINPSIVENIQKIQKERYKFQVLLKNTIAELYQGKFDGLVKTLMQEKMTTNTLQKTIRREKMAIDSMKSLQREVGGEKKVLEDEMNDRNLIIQQLKDTVHEVNILTLSEQKYIKKEVKAHESSVKIGCSYHQAKLLGKKELVMRKIEQERLSHEKIMDFLNAHRLSLDKSIQDWMNHYEEDSESKASELEKLKLQRAHDLDKFEEMVISYEALEKVVEEDRKVKESEREKNRILSLRLSAASKIKRWYLNIKKTKISKTPTKKGKGPKSSKGKGKGKGKSKKK